MWAAINAAARQIYQAVIKESKEYWIEWDMAYRPHPTRKATSCPPTASSWCASASVSSSDEWRMVHSADWLSSPAMLLTNLPISIRFFVPTSNFTFYGPYLGMAESETDDDSDIESIRIAPTPVDTRQVELVSTAKFVEVEDAASFLMIPSDGHDALIDLATCGTPARQQ